MEFFFLYFFIRLFPLRLFDAASCSITSRGKVWTSNWMDIEDWAFYKVSGDVNCNFLTVYTPPHYVEYYLVLFPGMWWCMTRFFLFYFPQVVSGGVASNQYVRCRLDQVVKKIGLQLVCPPPRLCTDNGKSYFCRFAQIWMRCNIIAKTGTCIGIVDSTTICKT